MADANDLTALLPQLEQLKTSKEYVTINNTLDDRFHTQADVIITKWISNERLSRDESRFLDLYSLLQLSIVEYCLFHSGLTDNIQNIISQFPRKLFRVRSTEKLAEAVEYIRQEHVQQRAEDDVILVYIMRMIDARSHAYRLEVNCSPEMLPRQLYAELYDCLLDRQCKRYLHDVKANDASRHPIAVSNRHQFFLGCATYAVASFPEYKNLLKESNHTKYIYLLAKYIRVTLSKTNFEQSSAILHCLRGIFVLLNNCVPTENWIHLINKALANRNDDAAQQANPFNIDLFSLIVRRLLGSPFLRDQAVRSDSHEVTSLADTALIFVNKWFGTSIDRDDEGDVSTAAQVTPEEPSEVLRLFRSDEQFNTPTKPSDVIRRYIEAKFDRLRFMTVAVLSSLMSSEDFDDLQRKNINIWKQIVNLVFDFIHRADAHERREYKGMSFALLLRYLLRLLVQDGVKNETVRYIPEVIEYAKRGELDALRILQRISTNPDLKEKLRSDADLQSFVNTDANTRFDHHSNMYKHVQRIRDNLKPAEAPAADSLPPPTDGRQAFISYSHDNREQCDEFVRVLQNAGIFTKIWLDRDNIQGNIVDSITQGIHQSSAVFVLLSHAYCRSDMCRCEWEFARTCDKTVYPVFVQQGFKRQDYDWVAFYIRSNLYYKFFDKADLNRLIGTLQSGRLRRSHVNASAAVDAVDSHSVDTVASQRSALSEQDSPTKQFIAQWNADDVQNWCRNNKLDQWCRPLTQYHGGDLLELHRILKKDVHLQHIAASHQIPFLDVIKFRGELRKLVSPSMTTRTSTAKKRRAAKPPKQ